METKPIISIENSAGMTRVRILDIDISNALTNVSYSTLGKGGSDTMSLEISISGLLGVLSDITAEDIKNAREILAPYKESRQHFKELLLETPMKKPTK
nr:MAG TPA: hypothetical protein [Caudoviricetes sp.]